MGPASIVVQFVEFGNQLFRQLQGYSGAFEGAPKKVTDIERRLSLILRVLENIENDGKAEMEWARQPFQ